MFIQDCMVLIQEYPDISGHIQTGYPDIRISNLWISGHPDKSRQIQTSFRQPFRGEVYMFHRTSNTSKERAKTSTRPPLPPFGTRL